MRWPEWLGKVGWSGYFAQQLAPRAAALGRWAGAALHGLKRGMSEEGGAALLAPNHSRPSLVPFCCSGCVPAEQGRDPAAASPRHLRRRPQPPAPQPAQAAAGGTVRPARTPRPARRLREHLGMLWCARPCHLAVLGVQSPAHPSGGRNLAQPGRRAAGPSTASAQAAGGFAPRDHCCMLLFGTRVWCKAHVRRKGAGWQSLSPKPAVLEGAPPGRRRRMPLGPLCHLTTRTSRCTSPQALLEHLSRSQAARQALSRHSTPSVQQLHAQPAPACPRGAPRCI